MGIGLGPLNMHTYGSHHIRLIKRNEKHIYYWSAALVKVWGGHLHYLALAISRRAPLYSQGLGHYCHGVEVEGLLTDLKAKNNLTSLCVGPILSGHYKWECIGHHNEGSLHGTCPMSMRAWVFCVSC